MTRLGDDVVNHLQHGRLTGIGTTAVPLAATPLLATRGVQLKASPDNGEVVYVGLDGVTPGTQAATDGFPLDPGEGLFLPLRDAAKLRLVSPASGQTVYFCVV